MSTGGAGRGRGLGIVVALAGAAGLALEVCASRLMAPFFGSSTVVWANIIGLILLYLSAGYWLGGRYADRHPTRGRLGALLLIAAIAIALLPFVSKPLLSLAVTAVAGASIGTVIGSFVGTLLLFAVPVTLLGMVSPFALRLSLSDIHETGTIAGRLYALSTLGSLAGTFIPALISIPLIGTQRTILAAAVLCGIAAAMLLGRRAVAPVALIALALLLPPGVTKEQPGLVAEAESQYQYIDVVDQPNGSRNLELDEGIAVHSVWRTNTVLTGGEWDMFLAVPPRLDHPVRSVLIIGDAGGTTARAFGVYYPAAHIDGVEIDPTVTAIGRQYMGLGDNPNLTVHEADGRSFLETSSQRWDLIIVDAYRQPYIPFQLTTQEFFQLCQRHLTEGGAVALNVERVPGDTSLDDAIETTVASVIPDTWVWPALTFNELVVAVNDQPQATAPYLHRAMPGDIAVLGTLMTSGFRAPSRHGILLTDDRAPVEWLTDRGLLGYIAGGGTLTETLLPTYPG